MVILNNEVIQRVKEAVEKFQQYAGADTRAAFLFGSQLNGSSDQYSDIDIALFVEGLENWDLEKRVQSIVAVQEHVGDDIELHLFPSKSYENPPKASFAEYVIKNGEEIF